MYIWPLLKKGCRKNLVQTSRYTLKRCFLYRPKRCAMFWNGFLSSWVFLVRFLIFVLRSISYFTFVVHSGNFWQILIFFCVKGGSSPFNAPFLRRAKPPTSPAGGSAPTPRAQIILDWIQLANWFSGITVLRLWIRFSGPQISRIFEITTKSGIQTIRQEVGCLLTKNMQTPPLSPNPPLQKWSSWHKRCSMC